MEPRKGTKLKKNSTTASDKNRGTPMKARPIAVATALKAANKAAPRRDLLARSRR